MHGNRFKRRLQKYTVGIEQALVEFDDNFS